jgi:hypothetical protein
MEFNLIIKTILVLLQILKCFKLAIPHIDLMLLLFAILDIQNMLLSAGRVSGQYEKMLNGILICILFM